MPPPTDGTTLPDRMLPLTVSVPSLWIAPPWPAELLDRVQLLTISVPSLWMPPPSWRAELPDRVLPLTVSVPWLRMPPPSPNGATPLATPLLIVRPLTVTDPALVTSNTREVLLPLTVTVSGPAPGPAMV